MVNLVTGNESDFGVYESWAPKEQAMLRQNFWPLQIVSY